MRKTFTGETFQEAMEKVKASVGDDVFIISHREIKKKSLTSPGLYEIVVEIEDDKVVKSEQKKRGSISSNIHKDEDVFVRISEAAKQIDKLSKESENSILTTDLKSLKNEMDTISQTMKLLQSTIWDLNACQRDIIIPPEFGEIYSLAKNSGISKTHLDEIMTLTLEHMPLKMRQNPITIKRYFFTILKRLIPIRQERELTGIKKIMMFVGPTGVGKTTTIAKLAARYALKKSRKYKVGIITLDTYRIGAVEQLMTYAKMMKLPIEAVVDPSDFVSALNRLRNNDLILIDTVGSSQHDKEKVDKINSFLAVNTFATIDVNLVLSATTKYSDLKDIFTNFSILEIDTLVFTKLDETLEVGNIFSLVFEVKKPISYFSVGQEVPDDLRVASSEFLVEKMLKDIK